VDSLQSSPNLVPDFEICASENLSELREVDATVRRLTKIEPMKGRFLTLGRQSLPADLVRAARIGEDARSMKR
jgi:hypothetical protein